MAKVENARGFVHLLMNKSQGYKRIRASLASPFVNLCLFSACLLAIILFELGMSIAQEHDFSLRRRIRMESRIRNLCDAVGDFIEYWGFKAIHGKVWTILALRREPMAQIEVAEFLGVSRSLVNAAIRELSDHGLVQPISDHRNSPYSAVVDIWPTISDILREREWGLIANAKMAVESAIEEAEFNPASKEYDLSRLRYLLRLTDLAQAFLRSLIGIRTAHRKDSLGDWMKRCGQFMRDLRTTH